MGNKNNKLKALSARIGRVERKCNRILIEVTSLRKALVPDHSEVDEVIGHLHRTAIALHNQSKRERKYFTRNAKEE